MRAALAGIALLAFTVAYSGAGLVPPEHYQRLSQNPFTTRTDIDTHNYWQESVLLPVGAYYLGMTGRIRFNALCAALTLAGLGVFAARVRRELPERTALFYVMMLLAHPVTSVLISWVGMPDCITFLLTAALLFTPSPLAYAAACALGALNHPAIIAASLSVAALRALAGEAPGWRRMLAAQAIGCALGYAGVRIFLAANGIAIQSRADFAAGQQAELWRTIFFSSLPPMLFSLEGSLWPLLIYSLAIHARHNRRYAAGFAGVMALSLAITYYTADTTRIFALLTWAPSLHCLLHARRTHAKHPAETRDLPRYTALTAAIGLLMPRYYAWGGAIHFTPFAGFYTALGAQLHALSR